MISQLGEISVNISKVLKNIELCATKAKPRLVVVSKTRPIEDIIEAYNSGQRLFGENYILKNCPDILWHFIGSLQSKKCSKLAKVPNLVMIETIHENKIAQALDKLYSAQGRQMKALIQVNTSGEDTKSGVAPNQVLDFYNELKQYNSLNIVGLMTIGKYGYDINRGPNPDFLKLVECRDKLCNDLRLESNCLELSMGMSSDYEHAIELGATIVRVGTLIFGERAKTSETL